MSEKPEAWRAIDSLIWPHIAAKLVRRLHAENERLREEVRNWKKSFVGHVYVKNEDYAELISKRDALKTENERLRGLLTEAAAIEPDCGCVGCSDKREALKVRIDAALRREDEK